MTGVGGLLLGDLTSPEAMSGTLRAERACWETYLTYFDLVEDSRSRRRAAVCFTSDARITYGMRGEPLNFNGRDEYADFLDRSNDYYEMMTNVVGQYRFAWDQGRVRLISKVTSWQWLKANSHKGKQRPADFVAIGHTEDEFTQIEGVWLISCRVVKPAAGATAIGILP